MKTFYNVKKYAIKIRNQFRVSNLNTKDNVVNTPNTNPRNSLRKKRNGFLSHLI